MMCQAVYVASTIRRAWFATRYAADHYGGRGMWCPPSNGQHQILRWIIHVARIWKGSTVDRYGVVVRQARRAAIHDTPQKHNQFGHVYALIAGD